MLCWAHHQATMARERPSVWPMCCSTNTGGPWTVKPSAAPRPGSGTETLW